MNWFKELAKELFTGSYDDRFDRPMNQKELEEYVSQEIGKYGLTVDENGEIQYKPKWYEVLTGIGWSTGEEQ